MCYHYNQIKGTNFIIIDFAIAYFSTYYLLDEKNARKNRSQELKTYLKV